MAQSRGRQTQDASHDQGGKPDPPLNSRVALRADDIADSAKSVAETQQERSAWHEKSRSIQRVKMT